MNRTAADSKAGRLFLSTAASGRPTLAARIDGRTVSLHSRVDPDREAEQWAERVRIGPGDAVVVFGLGLGYHAAALLDRLPADAAVFVVEADPAIAALADQAGIWPAPGSRPDLEYLVGLDPEDAAERIGRFQRSRGLIGVQAVRAPALMKPAPDYYRALEVFLTGRSPEAPPGRLGRPHVRALLVDSDYFLVRELHRALDRAGAEVRMVSLAGGPEVFYPRLMDAVRELAPDFLLTVNHFGFDADGVLTDLLSRLGLPAASWFVDRPGLVLGPGQTNASDQVSVFLWDRDYAAEMRGLGFERIHYLPLGTDETLFRPSDAPASGDVAVGFVGDSMNRAVAKYAARIPSWPKAARQVDEAARRLIDQTGLTPHGAIAADGLARRPEIRSLDPAGRLDLEALVTWRATQMYRLRMIRALAEFRPVVVGDEGWRDHLDDRFRPRPPVDYYQELPDFYRTCRVNFNATSLQMKGGVNQRLFDVPACGGFLITDRRAQAEALFESGREMICYDHPDQARQMVRYYLTHERERLSVARRARDRVLAEHTYVHRVRRMIDCMRRDHGRPARRR